MAMLCMLLVAASARRLVRTEDESWPFKAMKDLYKNVVQGDFRDYDNGVCFDRAMDHEDDGLDYLPFYQRYYPRVGKDLEKDMNWVEAVAGRYMAKYHDFVAAVEDNVAKKHRKKGDKSAHLDSAGVDETLQRLRGFEKCRDFVGLMDRKTAQTCRFRVGKKSFKWFSEAEIKAAKPNSQGQKILEAKCMPTYALEDAANLEAMMTEGDDCCQEDCEKGDGSCRPCAPACARDAKGRISCDVQQCFEECKDENGGNRVCTGLKSMARWAAKELKITLSFDTCPKLDSEERWDLKDVKGMAQRKVLDRQYCGLFDPTSTCHVKMDQVLMRGDATSRWSAEESNTRAVVCADTSHLQGDEYKRSRDLVSWALKKAVRDNDDAENGEGAELAKGTGSGIATDGVEKGKIKKYFIPQGTDPDTVGRITENDEA